MLLDRWANCHCHPVRVSSIPACWDSQWRWPATAHRARASRARLADLPLEALRPPGALRQRRRELRAAQRPAGNFGAPTNPFRMKTKCQPEASSSDRRASSSRPRQRNKINGPEKAAVAAAAAVVVLEGIKIEKKCAHVVLNN